MNEETLFELALNLSDAERAAMLDRECAGNPDLRERVEALLAAHAASQVLIDPPNDREATRTFGDQTKSFASPLTSAGTIVAGKYKLLQQIGEGGMGTVWMADQTEPVKRRVAVKLIHAERGSSKTILSRFEAERQAIALMDHPHIAKLLDAGTTEEQNAQGRTSLGLGIPYFVMELVKGVPLTDFCDAHKLSIPARLNLFMQICSAVQHAHQKGIIHRDLKPSNILVESHDGKPVPKVIDFGLAKATSGLQLTEHTLFTGFGTVMGTPLYMSPEQAAFNAVDVDTRADVYALGVILYELLTGTTPLMRETVKKAALDEMLKLIREQEAPTPSRRLSSSESKPTVAANRQSEPLKLGRFVKGELDWIVMKALSKERDRRYETANGFAKDVERFLNHEPLQAGPPSASYKLRKFVRRNRGQVIAAGLLLATLLTGIAGTTYGLIRADQQRRLAEAKQQEAEVERAKAASSAIAEAAQRKKAEQAEAETLDDYRASTDEAIGQLIGSKPDLGPQEKEYLKKTMERWKAFAGRSGDDERSRAIRAEGHFKVALLWVRLGRYEQARAENESARELAKQLVEQFPDQPKHRSLLAGISHNLGTVFVELGMRDEARAEYQSARGLQKTLVEQFPAVALYQKLLAITQTSRGIFLEQSRQPAEALAEHQSARELERKLVEQFPDEPEYRFSLAGNYVNVGTLLNRLGKHNEAQAELRKSRDLLTTLVEQFPDVPRYRDYLARNHVNLANMLSPLGKQEEARAEYRAAIALGMKLVEEFPSAPDYRHLLANTQRNFGDDLVRSNMWDEARPEYLSAIAMSQKLAEQFPNVPKYQVALGGTYCNFGILFRDEGKTVESLEWYDRAIRILQPAHEKAPRNLTAKEYLFNSHWGRAVAFNRLQRLEEAEREWGRTIELGPPNEQPKLHATRALLRHRRGQFAEAVADVCEATKSETWNDAKWYDFACVYAVASNKIADKKQQCADRAMELLHQAVKAGYKDVAHMAKDTDLDPLRKREDFKTLLRELEGKK